MLVSNDDDVVTVVGSDSEDDVLSKVLDGSLEVSPEELAITVDDDASSEEVAASKRKLTRLTRFQLQNIRFLQRTCHCRSFGARLLRR